MSHHFFEKNVFFKSGVALENILKYTIIFHIYIFTKNLKVSICIYSFFSKSGVALENILKDKIIYR